MYNRPVEYLDDSGFVRQELFLQKRTEASVTYAALLRMDGAKNARSRMTAVD